MLVVGRNQHFERKRRVQIGSVELTRFGVPLILKWNRRAENSDKKQFSTEQCQHQRGKREDHLQFFEKQL